MFFIVIIIIIVFYVFISRKNEENISNGIEKSIEKKEYIYSRVNFFLDKEYRASINIPEYWEGNYRKIEEGNKVDFVYLDKGIESKNIFSIEIINKNDINVGDIENLLTEDDKYYFIYKEEKEKIDNSLYNLMKSDVELILKSFKVS